MKGESDFMKLEQPVLIEDESEFDFYIADRIDLTQIKIGHIRFRGKGYNFEGGKAEHENNAEIHMSTNLEHTFRLDEEGNVID